MAGCKHFSAVFVFLALILTVEIRSVEGRHLKFHSKELNTHKRFLTREIAKVFEGWSSFRAADVQSPPAAPLTPPAAAVVGASPPGTKIGGSGFHAAGVQSPPAAPLTPPAAAVVGASPPGPKIRGSGFHAADVQSAPAAPLIPTAAAVVGASQPPPQIRSVEGRHLKFHSEELNIHKRFLARETEKLFEGRMSSFHAADVQSPPASPLTPPVVAVVVASQPPPPIQSFEVRHLKFHSEELNTHKRLLARETEKVFEGGRSFHAADVQSPPAAPLTPPAAAIVGASQPPPPSHAHDFRPAAPGHSTGIGHYIEAVDANVWHPPPAYLDHTAFFYEKKVDPFTPPAPVLNPPNHH